jgi:hypothetical protein
LKSIGGGLVMGFSNSPYAISWDGPGGSPGGGSGADAATAAAEGIKEGVEAKKSRDPEQPNPNANTENPRTNSDPIGEISELGIAIDELTADILSIQARIFDLQNDKSKSRLEREH